MIRTLVVLLLISVVIVVVVATSPVFDLGVPSSLEVPTASVTAVSGTETVVFVPTLTFTPTSTAIPPTPTVVPEVSVSLALDTVDFVKILALHRVKFPEKTGPVVNCTTLPAKYPWLLLPDWRNAWDEYAQSQGLPLVGLYGEGEFCLAPSLTSPSTYKTQFELDDNFTDFVYLFRSDDMCTECNAYILFMGPAVSPDMLPFGEWEQENGYTIGYSIGVPRMIQLAWNILGFVADGVMPQEYILNVHPGTIILVLPADYSVISRLGIEGSGWVFDQ